MEYHSLAEILYADACLLFIATGIVCAIIRWCHMCHPYDEQSEFYYPARRQVTFYYSAVILLLPYFLQPGSEAAWHYARVFGIIYYPVCFALIFLRYFQRKALHGWGNWMFFSVPAALISFMAIALLAGRGGWLDSHFYYMQYVLMAFSLMLSTRLVMILFRMKKQIDEFHNQNFASEDDFPYRFAEKVLWMPMGWILLMWTPFIIPSRTLFAVCQLLCTCWMVAFLCIILHPQIPQNGNEKEEETDETTAVEMENTQVATPLETPMDGAVGATEEPASTTYSEEAKQAVLQVILTRYREKHLLKTEVLADLDRGQRAGASRFMAEVGYYRLVNMFRLEHASQYIDAHPNATLVEIADEAGFSSDSAYCKARRSVPPIEPSFVGGVHL